MILSKNGCSELSPRAPKKFQLYHLQICYIFPGFFSLAKPHLHQPRPGGLGGALDQPGRGHRLLPADPLGAAADLAALAARAESQRRRPAALATAGDVNGIPGKWGLCKGKNVG